jgi:hypothetical protein
MHFSNVIATALTVFIAFTTTQSFAQYLPAATRTVFKCEVDGKIVYSDAPCLGAKKIDVEPTRGLNKSSGRELIGNDIRREQNREIFAEAVRPITGMNAKQLDTQSRRLKLSADAQRECHRLDSEIPATEIEEKRALHTKDFPDVKERLLHLRHSFAGLRC